MELTACHQLRWFLGPAHISPVLLEDPGAIALFPNGWTFLLHLGLDFLSFPWHGCVWAGGGKDKEGQWRRAGFLLLPLPRSCSHSLPQPRTMHTPLERYHVSSGLIDWTCTIGESSSQATRSHNVSLLLFLKFAQSLAQIYRIILLLYSLCINLIASTSSPFFHSPLLTAYFSWLPSYICVCTLFVPEGIGSFCY